MRKHISLILFLLVVAVFFSCARKNLPPINTDANGLAIKGYDPVAYFTLGEPTKGSEEFEYATNGTKWRFANAEDLELFKANPGKYTPRYGGYCAWAVSRGTTADIDPSQWTIVDGKLYLNVNRDIQEEWRKDIPGNIEKADRNWPGVLTK